MGGLRPPLRQLPLSIPSRDTPPTFCRTSLLLSFYPVFLRSSFNVRTLAALLTFARSAFVSMRTGVNPDAPSRLAPGSLPLAPPAVEEVVSLFGVFRTPKPRRQVNSSYSED